jgi:hypothetical protein
MKLKNTLTGIVLLVAALLGSDAEAKSKEPSFDFMTSYNTKYMAPFGLNVGENVTGKKGVNWTVLSANYDSGLSFFLFSSYDHSSDTLNEVDLGVHYERPVSDDLSAYFTGHLFTYPSRELGHHIDPAVTFGLRHSGVVDTDLYFRQVLPTSNREYGNMTVLSVSKTSELEDICGLEPSLTVGASTCYVSNYFGFSGHTTFTPGVTLGLKVDDNTSIEGYYNYQFGLDKETGIGDEEFAGVRVKKKF